jgi:hypothetical protein
MTKPFVPALAVGAMFVLAACGNATSAAPSSSPSPGAAFRNGASGQLVQINGQTLILTGPNGDVTVTYTTATTFTKTSIGTLADIVRGTCIFATGQKDAAGAVTATTVLISPKTASGCAARGFGPNGGPGGSPAPGASPRPSPTARPSAAANAAFVSGEVTSVSGPSITVQTSNGSQTISVGSTSTITHSATVTASALQNGQCVRANGSKDSAGDVQATSITITPAGPSGTCTAGQGDGRRLSGGGGTGG